MRKKRKTRKQSNTPYIPQKDNVKDNISCSSAKVLMEHAVMMVSGSELSPRPAVFMVLNFHEMDVPLPDPIRLGESLLEFRPLDKGG